VISFRILITFKAATVDIGSYIFYLKYGLDT